MEMIQSAEPRGVSGTHRLGEFFRRLSPEALSEFKMLEQASVYPANTVLFLERDTPRGIFVLREGRMKLSISSRDGKKLILRLAGPGDLLDMTAAISGKPYEFTAETVHSCKIAFMRREDS
jgi:CRP/FNR family cyclic AMP-dependent transcriptional regulator